MIFAFNVPSVPVLLLLAGAGLAVLAVAQRNLLLFSRVMIIGGWFVFAISSPTAQLPQVLRPVSNAMFAVGALLHWFLTKEDRRGHRDPNRRIAMSTRMLVVYVVFVLIGCVFSPLGPSNLVRGIQGAIIVGTAFYASGAGMMTGLLAATFFAALGNTAITVIQQKQELDNFGMPTGRLAGDMQPNHLAFAAAEVMIGVMWALPRNYQVRVPFLGKVSMKWPLIIWGLIATYAMYASESRTAWLAVIPAMGLAWFTGAHPAGRRKKVVTYAVAALVILAPIAGPAVGSYLSRDSGGQGENITSLTGRTDFWPLAVDLIEARPIIGYGPNVIGSPLGEKFQEVLPGVSQAHNAYLEAGLQAGLIGAAAFALSLIGMMVGAFSLPKDDDLRMLIIAGSVLTFIFTFTESNPAWFGDMFIVYVMCAAMYGERLPNRVDLRQGVQRSRRLVSA